VGWGGRGGSLSGVLHRDVGGWVAFVGKEQWDTLVEKGAHRSIVVGKFSEGREALTSCLLVVAKYLDEN